MKILQVYDGSDHVGAIVFDSVEEAEAAAERIRERLEGDHEIWFSINEPDTLNQVLSVIG